MEKYLFCFLFLSLFGCTNKISPYFEVNKYLAEGNSVLNDSLKFFHESYGDVRFIKSKSELKKQLHKNLFPYSNVLVYGKTCIEPIYEYYILIDNKKPIKKNHYFKKDTLINNHTFTFLGIPLDNSNPKEDFNYLSEKITCGSAYTEKRGSAFDIIKTNQFSNQFLKGLSELNDFPVYSDQEKGTKLQLQLTFASFLGQNKQYELLLSKWRNHTENDSIIQLIKNKGIIGLEAVQQKILSSVKEEKLIMFNENHFYPNHRILLTKLLPNLKKSGFNYLALETLDQGNDSILNCGKALTMETGFYTREQHFAELIRTAQALGFKFVAYENFDETKNREIAEADNLYNKTFGKDPTARVVVFAGISHITEQPDNNDKKWMAMLFREKYGINPITFSQTDLSAYHKQTNSIVLLESKYLQEQSKNTDYKIINNLPLNEPDGNFIYTNKFNQPVQATLYFEDDFKKSNDYPHNVPYRCCLLDKNEMFRAQLPKSKIRLIVFDQEGKVLENKIIN